MEDEEHLEHKPDCAFSCKDGEYHLEHIYPIERFQHEMASTCICDPEATYDEFGGYYLHFGVGDDSPQETRKIWIQA